MAPEKIQESSASTEHSTSQWLSDVASDCWSSAKKFTTDHPVVATAAAIGGTAAAIAIFKGRAGNVLEAANDTKTIASVGEGFASASALKAETAALANISDAARPVWISGSEKITPAGIHLITTDLSMLGGAAHDAFPQIPKLIVSDPIYRAGGLVTNFEGNLPALYDVASKSVVQLQVTKMSGAVELSKVGSGFFNPAGEIVTAHHVIDGGEKINVIGKLFDQPLKAAVKYTDPDKDIAVLKLIDPHPDLLRKIETFKYRPFNEILRPTEQVVGFGYPDGVRTLTAMPGNFSNWKNIQLGTSTHMTGDAMRTFMEAGPGASGGAMVDAQGRLFGTIVQMQPGQHAAWSVPLSVLRGT